MVESVYLFSLIRCNDQIIHLRFSHPFDVVRDNSNFSWKSFIYGACNTVNKSIMITDKLENKFNSFKHYLRKR